MTIEGTGVTGTPEGGASPAEGTATATPTNSEFNATLPEGLQANESLYGFDGVGSLAQGYADQFTQVGDLNNQITELQGKVPVVPAGTDGYEIQKPEGYQTDDNLMGDFLKTAHENGLTTQQANAMLALDHSRSQKSQEASLAAEGKALDDLKGEWGDSFDTNADLAKRAVEKIGGPELKEFLDNSRLGNSPDLVKMFFNISKAISEDSLLTGGTNTQTGDTRPLGIDGKPQIKFNM